MRLPQRQRETLSLRELEGLSYDEIAATMAVSRDTVAQLISRARINLCDELHGTVLASIAAPSPECERALPLIAAREDAQLEAGSPEAAWLDAHLTGCDRCRRGVEAMREGGASYRAWTSPAAGLSVAAAERRGKPPGLHLGRPPGLRLTLIAGLAVALLLAGLAAALIGSERPAAPAKAAAGAALGPTAGALPAARRAASSRKRKRSTARRTTGARFAAAASTLSIPAAVPAPSGSGAPSASAPHSRHSPGKAAVKPTRHASAPRSSQPAPAPAAAPTPAPAPATEGTPAGEESPKERHRQHEPHGKGAGRPPR